MPSTADAPLGVGVKEGSPKQVLQGINFANFATNEGVDGYVKMYGNILDTHREAYRVVFEKLKEGDGGVLFHCTGLLILFLPCYRFCLLFFTALNDLGVVLGL